MTFFNSKEEVIDIELTDYGRHLLSKGRFRPAFYEFYDDDIVYDSEYIGLAEKQSQINTRIKTTPRTKVQYTFSGAEERVKNFVRQARELGLSLNVLESSAGELVRQNLKNQDNFVKIKRTLYTNFLPLGNSSLDKNTYPTIKTKFITGELDSTGQFSSSAGLPNSLYFITLKDLEYKKFVDYTNDTQAGGIVNFNESSPSKVIFSDQSFINLETNDIFLEITELNTDNLKENFEISLFKIEVGINEKEISLSFLDTQEKTKIINNILIDNEDYDLYERNLNTGGFNKPEFSEYFLEINTDKQIPQNILCKYLSKEEINRLKIVEGYDIFCEEDQELSTFITNESISGPTFNQQEEEED